MSKNPHLIEASSLRVGYSNAALLPAVSFTLNPGQALALVGPNGSGKTTILKTLTGELAPLGGQILTWGEPLDDRTASFRSKVAAMSDTDAYLPALTVREHLLLTARGHGVEKASQLVTETIEEFGLTTHAGVLPTSLSSGQRRRMLLASLFVRPRRVLFLDEPEARLDRPMIDRLKTRLNRELSEKCAIVFACHDPQLVAQVATHALWLDHTGITAMKPDQAALQMERTS